MTDEHYGSLLIIHQRCRLRAGKIQCCGFQGCFFLIHSYSKVPQNYIKELIKTKGFIYVKLQLAANQGHYSKAMFRRCWGAPMCIVATALAYTSFNLETDRFNCLLPSYSTWLTCSLVWCFVGVFFLCFFSKNSGMS